MSVGVITAEALSAPASDGEAVDISSTDFSPSVGYARAFRVGTTAGDVKVKTANGNDLTIPSVQVGELIPLMIEKVYKTGTTAAGITVFW